MRARFTVRYARELDTGSADCESCVYAADAARARVSVSVLAELLVLALLLKVGVGAGDEEDEDGDELTEAEQEGHGWLAVMCCRARRGWQSRRLVVVDC